jgi:hypothetical protein
VNSQQLKSAVDRYRVKLREKTPKLVAYSPTGPIEIEIIDVVVEAIASLENRIAALEHASGDTAKNAGSASRWPSKS